MPQKFHHYITSDFVSPTRKMNYNDCDVVLLSLNKLHRGLDAASEVIYRANVNSIIKIEDEFWDDDVRTAFGRTQCEDKELDANC